MTPDGGTRICGIRIPLHWPLYLARALCVALVTSGMFYYVHVFRHRYAIKETAGNRASVDLFGGSCDWNPAWSAEVNAKYRTAQDYANRAAKVAQGMDKRLASQNIDSALAATFNDAAIIHFRCSDSPFDHLQTSHLPKESFYRDTVLPVIRQHPEVKRLVMLLCTSHQCANCVRGARQGYDADLFRLRAEHCESWGREQLSWLQHMLQGTDIDVQLHPSCLSLTETYAAFVGSAVLVGTGGSFSFLPGLTKGKAFVSQAFDPSHCEICPHLHSIVHWTMPEQFSLAFIPNDTVESFEALNATEYRRLAALS